MRLFSLQQGENRGCAGWRFDHLELRISGQSLDQKLRAHRSAVSGQDAKTAPKKPEKAAIDKSVTDFKLKDVMQDLKPGEKEEAAYVSLSQFKDKKAVVLFFMSEKCGTTWRYEKRVGKLLQDYVKKDLVYLGVRSSAADTCEDIRKFAEAKNFAMPVLDDVNNKMADYYQVKCTPTFVLIDKKGVMRYFGSFDNSANEDGVTKKYLPDAVAAVLEGKDVPVKQTQPFG